MPVTLPLFVSAAMTLSLLGSEQQARLGAWLEWAAAYRDCYEPAPFSLLIDKTFTAHCIESTLRQAETGGSPAQRAATEALITATPQLITLLNVPVGKAKAGEKAAGIDPTQAPAVRSR